jgi:hypothetical protein
MFCGLPQIALMARNAQTALLNLVKNDGHLRTPSGVFTCAFS